MCLFIDYKVKQLQGTTGISREFGMGPRAVLPTKVAISHIWPFKFKLVKIKLYFLGLTSHTFQMLDGHVWLVATILDSTGRKHFHGCRKVH